MKFIITGGGGFIGRHLASSLEKKGHTVTLISSFEDLSQPFDSVDHIFHLAAKTSVEESWENPPDFIKTNTLCTAQVLEKARFLKCSFTYVSSFFGADAEPANPYSLSKVLGEKVCAFYAQKFGIPIVILRLANVYGPHQKSSFLIPHILSQLFDQACREIVVKDLHPKRDYIYVDDVVDVLFCTLPQHGIKTFNIGTGVYTSVEEVIQILNTFMVSPKSYKGLNTVRLSEINLPEMDCKSTHEALDWLPSVSIQEGLNRLFSQKA